MSDRDLNEIRFQVNNLALNQKRIIHVVEKELSLINESRALIHENRQSIIEIVGSIRKLELMMKEIKRDFENQISANRYVLEVYARLVLVMEEIKFLLRDARFYLVDLKSKLGYLSLGKKSTDVISPITLKTLLLEIQDNTPDLISLIADPKRELWSFYK